MTAGPTRTVAAALVLAGCLLAGLAASADAGGRVLLLPAALLLLGLGARDLLLRPVLHAGEHGIEVVTGVRRVRAGWAEVERLRVVTDRRTPVLELDLGDAVIVLGRLRLGRAPADVLDELLVLRSPTTDEPPRAG